jgi:hypothetical protein
MAKKWDFKNSPAMGHLKKAGKAVSDALGLSDDSVSQTRNEHFDTGATEHFKPGMNDGNAIIQVPEQYAEADQHFEEQGLGYGSEGNVTSIRRGVALKGERMARKPKGY